MANEIKLPRLAQGMETGTVLRWLKNEGERVKQGELLYELDTEKVTQEIEAPSSGVLLRIAVSEGEAPVGAILAYIGEEGEELPAAAAPAEASAEAPSETVASASPLEAAASAPTPAAPADSIKAAVPGSGRDEGASIIGGRVKASPLARRVAKALGVELAGLPGTGPEGRIVAEDVERIAESVGGVSKTEGESGSASVAEKPAPRTAALAPIREIAPGSIERVPLTNIRKTIVRRVTEAWQAPAFQVSLSADMSEAIAMRARLVERVRVGEQSVSVADFLTKACAQALVRHPELNALWKGEEIELHGSVDISIATSTAAGLVAPVIRACEQRTLSELAAARTDLVARAQGGSLTLTELEGGTFTISNLGTYDIEQFTAVLNPPQVAIIAVGRAIERPIAVDGEIEIAPILTLTLTCDHRAVDGSTAAEFLATVRDYLEEPGLML